MSIGKTSCPHRSIYIPYISVQQIDPAVDQYVVIAQHLRRSSGACMFSLCLILD